ncbi:hypothetical protein F5Y16DRAFT_410955 [Xylariaceae sp. FL0255]|nr:hypothetical protein F5Y16DRAFT_410955 [Xylariaceae sp. FL0255]
MPFLSPLSIPPLTSHLGLRAVLRASEKSIVQIFTFPAARRPFSILQQPCATQYSSRGLRSPYASLYNPQSSNLLPRTSVRTFLRFRATTQYIDLPKDYEDANGLPFRREDLTQRETNKIFGTLAAADANQLLRILHGRRVAGTLDDPVLARNTSTFKPYHIQKGLKYLREHIPVDEVLNAGLRAEDELRAIEERETTDRVLEGEEENNEFSDDIPDGKPTGRLPKRPGDDSPYGESSLDRLRAENIAKREAQEALEEEERKKKEELATMNLGGLQTEIQKPKAMSPFRAKYAEKATSDLKEPPKMTMLERFLPSLAMTLLVILGSVALATLYSPPPTSKRLWPEIPPAAATILGLMMVNIAVFALWKFPPAWPILNRYAILIPSTPRPLQLIGAVFSHQTASHLLVNMTFLWIFGTRVHDEIGRGNFLALYLTSGVVGFMTSFLNLAFWRGMHLTTLGASGAIYGVTIAYFWLHRYEEFKLFGLPPDPISGPQGLGFIGLILGTHLLGAMSKSKAAHKLDLASHIGGMVAAVVGIEAIQWYMKEQNRKREERWAVIVNLRRKAEEKEREEREKEEAEAEAAKAAAKAAGTWWKP